MKSRGLAVLGVVWCVATALHANGTGDDRVTLPDGPGSVGGSGQAGVQTGMGALTASFPIEVPRGFEGVTPELAFSYSSLSGASPLGIGWSLAHPALERMTNRGLPAYDGNDRMALDGAELVQIDDGEPAEYRRRFEGGFERIRWYERGDGSAGYFTVESGDGFVSFYGADQTGDAIASAQERGPDGVFRWLLVDVVDPFGHTLHHTWQVLGSKPLLSSMQYVFDGGVARYEVDFDYEARPDPVSDARAGYNDLLAHRMSTVRVLSRGATIRRYDLFYEDEDNAYGRSRLSRIEQRGKEGGLLNVTPTFVYARSLDGTGACDVADCGRTELLELGNIGVNLQARNATLIDINGDALPDLIESIDGQAHRIRLGQRAASGAQAFSAPRTSRLGADTSGFQFSSPFTQPLDVDGDGDVDVINSATGAVLENDGSGDWLRLGTLVGSANLPDFGEDFGLDSPDQLTHARFLDINLDRRIDLLRSDGASTQLFANIGNNQFQAQVNIDNLGVGFLADNVELGDLNGDGLLDAYILAANSLRYRQNLGGGRWADFVTIADVPVSQDELPFASLEDIDNDGCDDLVVVVADEVKIARNRAGLSFDDVEITDSVDGAPLPTRDATMTVLFADMNGNGSNDVVWFTATGDVTVLDVTPVPAHLLARIETAHGAVREIAWGTAAQHRADDAGIGWDFPLPMAALVVDRFEDFARANDESLESHIVTVNHYSGGYYDADEKAFRGFARVESREESDDGDETGVTVTTYDVGDGGRPAFAGRLLTETTSTSTGAVLRTRTEHHDLCDVDGVDNAALAAAGRAAVEFVCMTSEEVVVQEGADEAEWVTTRARSTYDGYGRVIEHHNDGVVAIGGGACGPCDDTLPGHGGACGAQCLGDEQVVVTSYVDPADNTEGRWLLPLAVVEQTHDGQGGRVDRVESFYDGADFIGLTAGRASKGQLKRVRRSVDSATAIDVVRLAHDAHGNVVENLNPSADVDGVSDRARMEYDELGLHRLREVDVVTRGVGTEGGPREIERVFTYDSAFGLVESATQSRVVGSDDDDGVTLYTYDEHGRVSATVEPGDSLLAPTIAYRYEIGSPYSTRTTLVRSSTGDEPDLETISCTDGLGRVVQTRQRTDDTTFSVSGYTVFNRRSQAVRVYDPFVSTSGACDDDIPASARATTRTFDALHRERTSTSPTGKEQRRIYRALVVEAWDEDDLDPTFEGKDTPAVMTLDGLNRVVRAETRLSSTSTPEVTQLRYDDQGNFAAVVDPEGNLRTQTRDLMGRITETDDATFGRTRHSYDSDSNPIRTEFADGTALVRSFDDLGRVVEEFVEGQRDTTLTEVFHDRHPDCVATGLALGCEHTTRRVAGQRSQTPLGVVEDAVSYDRRGLPLRTARKLGASIFVQENEWDNVGRLVKTRLPDGRELTMTVNRGGEVTAIPGYIDSIRHDADHRLAGYVGHNGVETSYAYDNDDRLAALTSKKNGTALVDLVFNRDVKGRITTVNDGVNTGLLSLHKAVRYDGYGRMIEARLGVGDDVETVNYGYDAVQRVIERRSSDAASAEHLGVMAYAGDVPQALSSTDLDTYRFDVRGRMVGRAGAHGATLAYDARGRLSSMTRDDTGTTTEWAWSDHSHLLWRKSGTEETLWVSPDFALVDGVARLSVRLAGDTVVEEDSGALTAAFLGDEDGDGAITAHDARLKTGQEQHRALRAAARLALLDDAGLDRRYPLADHVGTVVAVTDADGAVVERFATGASGLVRASSAVQTDAAVVMGADVDDSGLLRIGTRFYGPLEGRFITPDTTFAELSSEFIEHMPDSLALYSYAGNNPISNIDADGRFAWKKGASALAFGTLHFAGAVVAELVLTGLRIAALPLVVVGAVVGGVVGIGSKVYEMRATMRLSADHWQNKQSTARASAYGLASVLLAGGRGALHGALTFGVSAVLDLLSTAVTVAELNHVISGGRARVARGALQAINGLVVSVLGGVVGAVSATLLNPAQSAIDEARDGDAGLRAHMIQQRSEKRHAGLKKAFQRAGQAAKQRIAQANMKYGSTVKIHDAKPSGPASATRAPLTHPWPPRPHRRRRDDDTSAAHAALVSSRALVWPWCDAAAQAIGAHPLDAQGC